MERQGFTPGPSAASNNRRYGRLLSFKKSPAIAKTLHNNTSQLKLQLTATLYFASSDSGGDTQTHCDRGPDLRLCVRSVGASFRTIAYAGT
jgi:hypothetical protein